MSPSISTPVTKLPSPAVLLAWYDRHHRDLPWRVPPGSGGRADPYRVWLSEVMLQQTTVAAVKGHYQRFTTRWPRVEDLAAADEADVLAAWAGLGYYARARNLHRCAREVAGAHAGCFPGTEAGLAALPGIGAYTAAAIAAIAFGQPAVVVDGNVERVMARIFAETAPLPGIKPALRAHAARLTPQARPGDYAQAVMDLGATICTPRKPACALCPWRPDCRAAADGIAADLPVKAAKKVKPLRHGIAWFALAPGGIAVVRRPAEGLLGGMLALPSSDWGAAPDPTPPFPADWVSAGEVRHVFTHFRLHLEVRCARVPTAPGISALPEAEAAMPTVFAKACRIGRAWAGEDPHGRPDGSTPR